MDEAVAALSQDEKRLQAPLLTRYRCRPDLRLMPQMFHAFALLKIENMQRHKTSRRLILIDLVTDQHQSIKNSWTDVILHRTDHFSPSRDAQISHTLTCTQPKIISRSAEVLQEKPRTACCTYRTRVLFIEVTTRLQPPTGTVGACARVTRSQKEVCTKSWQ